jgi:hypothetical protein
MPTRERLDRFSTAPGARVALSRLTLAKLPEIEPLPLSKRSSVSPGWSCSALLPVASGLPVPKSSCRWSPRVSPKTLLNLPAVDPSRPPEPSSRVSRALSANEVRVESMMLPERSSKLTSAR